MVFGKDQSNKGKRFSESHKQKISIKQLGKNNSMYGIEPWNKGKKGLQKMTEEMRNNISKGVRKMYEERKQKVV